MNPENLNKYLYIQKTPTWLIRIFYIFGIFSWLLVAWTFFELAKFDLFFKWLIVPIIIIFTLYHLASFGLNLFYRRFNLLQHHNLVSNFWANHTEPTVDIFLPICGENMKVLRHTWNNVLRIKYRNKHVYVLDDSKEECNEHKRVAEQYGFTYFERPNKGEMKKAGNMKYAYERTNGEFIVVLDGDFAPHQDFLIETLPYMSNARVAIVQTPQYFEATKEVHKNHPIAYGAARAQEIFYRVIQVARDRLDGAHCCGTCAVYRRVALESIGGFVQMGHSEDAHTGFGLTSQGWIVRYIPVILSVGVCPDNAHSFFHQQHRWCLGNVMLTFDKKSWKEHIPWKIKFCYLTGFLYNIHYPLIVLFSFQLFYTLFVYNPYISLAGATLFYPYLIFSIFFLIFLPISRFRWGCVYADFLKAYSNSHAIFTILTNYSVGWIATNAKHTSVSSAFRQTILAVSVYVLLYFALIALAVRNDVLHIFNYQYYSIQFWLFYNLFFSGLLLWQMYRTMEDAKKQQILTHASSGSSLAKWQLKTVGLFTLLLLFVFYGIIFL